MSTSADADEATRKRYVKIQTAVDRLLSMIDDYLSPERMAAHWPRAGRRRYAAGPAAAGGRYRARQPPPAAGPRRRLAGQTALRRAGHGPVPENLVG